MLLILYGENTLSYIGLYKKGISINIFKILHKIKWCGYPQHVSVEKS